MQLPESVALSLPDYGNNNPLLLSYLKRIDDDRHPHLKKWVIEVRWRLYAG
ncbi:hypothetical protein [Bradyrhizobium sp. USDA 4520]